MRVPFAEKAVVDIRKLVDYLLDANHENGKHKAILWFAALGVVIEDADEISLALRDAVQSNDAIIGKFDRYGQRYTVDFLLD